MLRPALNSKQRRDLKQPSASCIRTSRHLNQSFSHEVKIIDSPVFAESRQDHCTPSGRSQYASVPSLMHGRPATAASMTSECPGKGRKTHKR